MLIPYHLRFVCLLTTLISHKRERRVRTTRSGRRHGGGMIGGSTERSPGKSTKPATKPATTTTPRKRTTPQPATPATTYNNPQPPLRQQYQP